MGTRLRRVTGDGGVWLALFVRIRGWRRGHRLGGRFRGRGFAGVENAGLAQEFQLAQAALDRTLELGFKPVQLLKMIDRVTVSLVEDRGLVFVRFGILGVVRILEEVFHTALDQPVEEGGRFETADAAQTPLGSNHSIDQGGFHRPDGGELKVEGVTELFELVDGFDALEDHLAAAESVLEGVAGRGGFALG